MGDGEKTPLKLNLRLQSSPGVFGVLLSPQTLDYLHAENSMMPWD